MQTADPQPSVYGLVFELWPLAGVPPVSGKIGLERIPDQLTFFTLPERMQRVHTCMRRWDP